MHDLGYHFSVSTVGYYSSSHPKLEKLRLFNALQNVIKEHPALSLQLRDTDTNDPCLIRLSRLDLKQIVSFKDATTEDLSSKESRNGFIERQLAEQNSTGFEIPEQPLWRLVVLSLGSLSVRYEHALIFSWHHVIADGKSGQAMHYAILKELNSLPETVLPQSPDGIVQPSLSPLLPSMDELFTYPKSWSSWLHHTISRYLPRSQPHRWTGAPYHMERGPKTLIRIFEVSSDIIFPLVDQCRDHQTSITALLQAAVSMVIFQRLPESEAEELRCVTAIELRRFIPERYKIDDTKIGLWIDGWHQDFSRKVILSSKALKDGVSWNEARNNKSRIDYEVGKGQYDLGFGDLKGIADFKPDLIGKIGKPRENSFSIINLGLCQPQGKDDDWRLEKLILSQSAHVNGSAMQFCFVSTRDGGMTVCVNWQEGTVKESFMYDVMTDLKKKLTALARTT